MSRERKIEKTVSKRKYLSDRRAGHGITVDSK